METNLVIAQKSTTDSSPFEVKHPRHNVVTDMYYYDDPGDGSPPTPVVVGSAEVSNERPIVSVKTTVRDITGEEYKYALDSHGFQLYRHESKYGGVADVGFHDEARIKTEYYAECEELYKEFTGASRIHIFGHRVRRGPTNWHKLGKGNAASRGPLHRAHIDQSYGGAVAEAHFYLPEEADELLKRRFQIINIWRPITTIIKDPLAVASSQSVPDEHLVAAKVQYATHSKETWTVLPPGSNGAARQHDWFFKHRQRSDEVLLIKCYDSDDSGRVARRAIHSAFVDPDTADWDGSRESVEVRALIFY